MCMLEPTEARRGHLVSWDWSFRDWELPSGCWGPNSGLLAPTVNVLSSGASFPAPQFS